MSHPLYNPYTSGNQNSSQGQYGVPGRQGDLRMPPPHLRPGSIFSSPGAPVNLGSSVGSIPSLLSLPSYRPEKRATMDEDIERSVSMHISQAREGVKHQNPGQRPCFQGPSRNELPSSVSGGTSYQSSTSFEGQRLSNMGTPNSTMDWLQTYNKVNKDSSKMFSSASSSFVVSGDGMFNSSNEERRDIPGLGEFDQTMKSNPTPPSEPSHPKYTSESAISILMNFGLEKEDLEHLISYPESQITPENLPFILREIRIKKSKSTSPAVQPGPYPKLPTTASRSAVDKLGDSRESDMTLNSVSASILKPSKVIDYGHTGKYNAGVEVGKIGESSPASNVKAGLLRMDTVSGGSHGQELHQRTLTEVKVSTSSGASSHEQVVVSSIGSLSSSLAPSSRTSTPIPLNQPSQYLFNMFNFSKKDTDMRQLNPDTSKSLPPKLPKSKPSTATPNLPKILTRGVHPQRPGLVVFDSKHKISNAAESEKQPPPSAKPNALQPKQQQINPLQQPEPIPPRHRTFSAVKPLLPLPVKLGGVPATAASTATAAAPLVTHQQIPSLMKGMPQKPTASLTPQTQVKVPLSMPTEAMIRDYVATTPEVFPHTCTLCKKESAHLKDWISHCNNFLHYENCKLLRTRFPKWVDPGSVCAGSKDPKPSTSNPAQTSQNQSRETKWSSSSPSRSPHRQRGPSDRRDRSRSHSPRRRYSSDNRDKHSSRSNSRSPHRRSDSRREKRSRSRSHSPHRRSDSRRERRSRSRSQSSHRRSDIRREKRSRSRSTSRHRRSESRREKHSRSRSPRSKHSRRSRTRSRSDSPRYSRNTSSRYRSRSRSRERRSSPRRRDEKRSPRRSRERRSSTERSSSTEKLAKKLLEKTAVQSLSKRSDLEAMVKTLAPALLAELAKMKSLASSSSAPSSSTKKESASKSSKGRSSPQKSESSSSGKPEGKSSPPTMVKLYGVTKLMSHGEVTSALTKIGKTKSVVIFRSELEALVCFENVEDAEKLKKMQSIEVKGTKVFVCTKKKNDGKETKSPNNPDKSASSDGTGTTTKSTGKGKAAACDSKKPQTTKSAAKAKVAVSKATSAPTNNAVKAVKTVNPDKKKPVKTTKANTDVPEPTGPKKTKVPVKTPAGNAKKPAVQKKTGKAVAKTAAKDTARKTADSKVSNKTPSQSTAGAEKMNDDTQKAETAGSPSGGAKTIKTETVENPTEKTAATSDKKEAAVLHKVGANPVELLEVKQEQPMEVVVSPGIKEGQGVPPQSTDESTPDEPPKPDAASTQKPEKSCTEAHQSPDPQKESPPQRPETEAVESSAEVEAQQAVSEDVPLKEKTQSNKSKADGDVSNAPNETAKATPEKAAGLRETKADPAADGTHGKNTSKLTASKKTEKKEDSPKASTSSQKYEDEIPQIDENLYRAFTAALREHKLKKNKANENKEGKKQENEGLSSSALHGQNFNLEDFVTLDEIAEDADNMDKTAKQSKEEAAAAKKSSPTKSSSKSTKNQKDSEPSKPSPSSKASKTSPSSSSLSDSQPSKTSLSKQSPSPSGRTTRSSVAARKAEETSQKQKVKTRATKSAVAKSDQSVAAESSAGKTVESEAKIESPSEVESKPQMQSPTVKEDDGEKRTNLDVQEDDSHQSSNEAQIPEDLQKMITKENKTEIQTQDGFTETQTSAAEQTLLPEGDATQSDHGHEKDPETNQTPSSGETEGNVKLTEEVSKTSEQTSGDKEQQVDPDADKELETLSQQGAKAEDEATEEEDEEYHVIDAIEDHPMTTESDINEHLGKDVSGATRKTGQKSKASSAEKDELPIKRDRKVKKTETQIKVAEEDTEDDPEDMIFEVLDSVDDESVVVMQEEKTSSVKGSPKSSKEEEEPSIPTRSTRGRRAATQVKMEDISSRRSTPTRQSLRQKDKLPKTEDEAPPKESTPTEKSSDVMKDTSEEDPAATDDQPPVQGKPRRGRPKKNAKRGKKQVAAQKKAESPVKEVEEDEEEFQIIDSVEGEAVDASVPVNQTGGAGVLSSKDEETKPETATGLPLNDEEEPLYQILDSVEDDAPQEEPTPTEVFNVEVEEEGKRKSPIKTEDCTASEDQRKLQSADGGDGSTEDTKTEEEPPNSSQSAEAASTKNDTNTSKNALKNLDEVSEEEEDYPDDTAEEEQLNQRLAAAKEREREQDEKRAQERERKSRSRSRGRSHRSPEKDKVDLETQELVTLDEVGADDAGEPDFEGMDSAVMEGEMQDLVTLDEIIEEEEEEETKESRTKEPPIQEGQSEDLLEQETCVEESTITGDQKPEEDAAEKSQTTAERKYDEETVESSNLSVVDGLEKAEQEEEKTVPTPKPKRRPRKKGRQTAVRKSSRGKESSTEDEKKEELETLDSSSTVDKETSEGDDKAEIHKPDEVTSSPDAQTTSTVEQLKPEITDKGMQEELVKENYQEELVTEPKGNKRQQELFRPVSKRARSESPVVSSTFLLPPYNPESPIGQEHIVPKSGFFCNICSIFYLTEKAAKEVHCSSRRHYESLQKHCMKVQWKSSRTQSSQGSLSD